MPTPAATWASPSTTKAKPTRPSANSEKAIRLRPDHADAHYNLGNALARQGHADEAIRQFQEALRLKPDNADAHNNLGLALARQGQTDEAIRQFQEALRLNPGHVDAHLNLGNALAGKGQMDEAIRQFQEALRLKPDYAQAHYNLGIILSMKGQTDGAIGQFQEAIRLQPAYPEALGSLAGTLDGQGKYAEAVRLYQAALKALPDQAGVLNNLAWLLATCPDAAFRNGPEAVRLATRACELTSYANRCSSAPLPPRRPRRVTSKPPLPPPSARHSPRTCIWNGSLRGPGADPALSPGPAVPRRRRSNLRSPCADQRPNPNPPRRWQLPCHGSVAFSGVADGRIAGAGDDCPLLAGDAL